MENAVEGLKMAFSVIVFAMALSVSMFAFSHVGTAAQVISYTADESNYYSNLEFDENFKYRYKRYVKGDTIIPTLYRYYKESFCVRIYDALSGSTNLIQTFDVNIEGRVANAARLPEIIRTDEQEELCRVYNTQSLNPYTYMFEAPWIGDTITHFKTRIDLFVSGQKGYINNVEVDYSQPGHNLKDYLDKLEVKKPDGSDKYVCEETFVKYTFTGDTISAGEGEDIETITGNKKPEDKIDITYTFKENN